MGDTRHTLAYVNTDGVTTEQKPTTHLKFSKDGRLQQLWLVTTYDDGVVFVEMTEWRDVPKDGDE